jgi:hypothetical protein
MAAPWKVFPVHWEIAFTAGQAERIRNRAVLEGTNKSQVVRDAVDAYLDGSATPSRRKKVRA